MEKMKNVIQSLKTWHKLVIGAALLAIVTGALLYFTLPDKYVVVYQNLNDADKQEITAELSKLGVDYQLVPMVQFVCKRMMLHGFEKK